MTPSDLYRRVDETRAAYRHWQTRIATANRRGGELSTADWRAMQRATADYDAALADMAAHQKRTLGEEAA